MCSLCRQRWQQFYKTKTFLTFTKQNVLCQDNARVDLFPALAWRSLFALSVGWSGSAVQLKVERHQKPRLSYLCFPSPKKERILCRKKNGTLSQPRQNILWPTINWRHNRVMNDRGEHPSNSCKQITRHKEFTFVIVFSRLLCVICFDEHGPTFWFSHVWWKTELVQSLPPPRQSVPMILHLCPTPWVQFQVWLSHRKSITWYTMEANIDNRMFQPQNKSAK